MTMQPFFGTEEDREESIIERRERERPENGKVENEEHIPLIPDVKKDVRKIVHEIQVWKLDKPGEGYKGAVSPHANIALIADLFGNGIYDFHAVTQDGKVLRRNPRVQVSAVNIAKTPVDDAPPNGKFDLLEWQARQHERDTQRVENFGQAAIQSTREAASQQLRAISDIHAASQSRDRDFFATLLQQQQQFFANMLASQQQAHNNSMERQREDFTRSLQLTRVQVEETQRANSPETVLQLLQAGMNLALGPGEDDDEDDEEQPASASNPWVQAIQTGADAIREVASAAKLKASVAVPKAPDSQPQTPPREIRKMADRRKKKLPLTRDEIREVLRAKQLMEQNNLDFVQTVRKATQVLTGGTPFDPSQPENRELPDSDETAESVESEPRSPDVDDG